MQEYNELWCSVSSEVTQLPAQQQQDLNEDSVDSDPAWQQVKDYSHLAFGLLPSDPEPAKEN